MNDSSANVTVRRLISSTTFGGFVIVAFLLLLIVSVPTPAFAWSAVVHRWISEAAIETLPEPLERFYRTHREEISDLAVEPDLERRTARRRESPKHFVFVDEYLADDAGSLPVSYKDAAARLGDGTVRRRGTLPWTMLSMHERLVQELRRRDWWSALETSGLAAHYVADAFMPLHATSNHDGEATSNRGIHTIIERRLIDSHRQRYRARVAKGARPASAEPFAIARVWRILQDSLEKVPALLAADRAAERMAARGSGRYVDELDARVGDVVGDRMDSAVGAVDWFWLSAWTEAGRPEPE